MKIDRLETIHSIEIDGGDDIACLVICAFDRIVKIVCENYIES